MAAKLWNHLPVEIRRFDSVWSFKSNFKTHFIALPDMWDCCLSINCIFYLILCILILCLFSSLILFFQFYCTALSLFQKCLISKAIINMTFETYWSVICVLFGLSCCLYECLYWGMGGGSKPSSGRTCHCISFKVIWPSTVCSLTVFASVKIYKNIWTHTVRNMCESVNASS